jgi:retinol dehydrogenase 14
LAKAGARIIMACRNLQLAEQVKSKKRYPASFYLTLSVIFDLDEIITDTGNANVVVKVLDISSFESVRQFAKDINETETRLDVLLHNAGYAGYAPCQSVDGIEMTMATNHYGPFLLTHLLIDLLKRSGPSRIVVVSSLLHIIGHVDLNNLNPLTVLPGYLYYVTKKANVLFAIELARRLQKTNVTANFLHPGLIDSGIWRNIPQPHITIIRLCNLFAKSTVEGAQTSIYASIAPELETVSGAYLMECRKMWFSRGNQEPERLRKFWESSATMCGLQKEDPVI